MAMTKCKECGSDVSTKALACPKCGAKPTKEFSFSLTKWFFGAIFLVLVYQFIVRSNQREEQETAREATMTPAQKSAQKAIAEEESLNTDAKFQCKEFVERGLKAPSTAKFPTYNSFLVTRSDGAFVVSGYVDAQNGFGAMLRTQFKCEVRKSGEAWQLVKLTTDP